MHFRYIGNRVGTFIFTPCHMSILSQQHHLIRQQYLTLSLYSLVKETFETS